MTPKTYLIPVPPREGECVTGCTPLDPGAPSGAGPPGPVPLTAHRAPGAPAGAPPGALGVELPSLEKDVPKAQRIGNVSSRTGGAGNLRIQTEGHGRRQMKGEGRSLWSIREITAS
ncbi:unnamed protein product [Arctogadus glacialis]